MVEQLQDARVRALLTEGVSVPAVYAMVQRAMDALSIRGGVIVDVGCGTGSLWPFFAERFDRYVGVDAVRYPDFPPDAEFVEADLNGDEIPLADGSADVVVSVETIEHLENPRRLMRQLARLARPGGWVIVTTPNQLSLLSLMTLAFKHQFSFFQDVDYPKHLTALLEVDLHRIAAECGLEECRTVFSHQGRVVFTSRHYPRVLSRLFPRALSDNVLLVGRKPEGASATQAVPDR